MGEEENKILFPNYKIKELEKKFNDLRVDNARLRERVFMLENKLDKIQAKKEVDYVKIIESLLERIVVSKDRQFADYMGIMTQILEMVNKKE